MDLQELLHELQQQPNQPRTLYLAAQAYLKLGQFEDAKKVWNTLARSVPETIALPWRGCLAGDLSEIPRSYSALSSSPKGRSNVE